MNSMDLALTPNELKQHLDRYIRWKKEGSLPYYVNPTFGSKVQYFYDTYHEHIEMPKEGKYHFHIQVLDSPDGDSWAQGIFTVNSESKVVILEQKIVSH